MTSALIAFATSEGQTERIASRIAEQFAVTGVDVNLRELGELGAAPGLNGFDLVVLGASIHVGSHQKAAVDFATAHAEALSGRSSAFFSVSLTASDHTPEAEATVQGYLQQFVEDTGWHPDRMACFAGRLAYTDYGFVKKRVVRTIARKGGKATDLTKDHEYTDWEQVDRFAEECLTLVAAERR